MKPYSISRPVFKLASLALALGMLPVTSVPAQEEPAARQSAKAGGKLTRHDYATEGDWLIEYFTDAKGKFHSTRATYFSDADNGLRVTYLEGRQWIDFIKPGVVEEGKEFGVEYWGAAGGKSNDKDGSVTGRAKLVKDEAGNPWGRIEESTEDGPGSSDFLANSKTFVIETELKKYVFDLKNSNAALMRLAECFAQQPTAGRKSSASSETTEEEAGLERIVLSKNEPAVKWHVDIPAGESKAYLVPVKKGQTFAISYLEDTRKGSMDFGKFSVEEGNVSEGKGLKFESEETMEYRLTVFNPAKKTLTFTIFISLE